MSEKLPATIVRPREFLESPPADFDGAFHWQYLDAVLMPYDGIRCSDVDALIERNGFFLSIETKNPGVIIKTGAERRTYALLRTGLFTQLDIWGKEKPIRYRFRRWDHLSTEFHEGEDCRAEIAEKVARWIKWADDWKFNPTPYQYQALTAAWKNAGNSARKQFAIDVMRPTLGAFDSTPLGQAFIERLKTWD